MEAPSAEIRWRPRLRSRLSRCSSRSACPSVAARLPLVRDIRGKGLLIGVEIDASRITARAVCERLLGHGLLSKDTHDTVIRLAPPLVIEQNDIDNAVDIISRTLHELAAESVETPAGA